MKNDQRFLNRRCDAVRKFRRSLPLNIHGALCRNGASFLRDRGSAVRYRTIGNGWSTGRGYESLYLQVAEQQGEMLISISKSRTQGKDFIRGSTSYARHEGSELLAFAQFSSKKPYHLKTLFTCCT